MRAVGKQASSEAQEVANLPDFVNLKQNREKKQTAAELLDKIKKDELKRVN